MITKVAAQMGIPLSDASTKHRSHWNGHDCALRNVAGDVMTTSNILHEFAHWFVACPVRRMQENFGLGSSPEDSHYHYLPGSWIIDEEITASAVGIAMEIRLRVPGWADTLSEHAWALVGESKKTALRKIVAELRKRRIRITRSGIPQREVKFR